MTDKHRGRQEGKQKLSVEAPQLREAVCGNATV